ncbi:MAG: TSUP family transporter [Euryarchaeota archaeon]|nr:TSUP family transporter [Euryarchaeota archaeon]
MIVETLVISFGIFVAAFLFAPIGMGGGMIFVPLLHYGLGWEINGALFAISLSLTAVVSWGSGLAHRNENHYDDSSFKLGLKGAIPGALLGVAIVLLIGDKLDTVFKVLSLIMISWAIYKTSMKMKKDSKVDNESDDEQQLEVQTLSLQIGSGIGGVLSSVLAIGAGVIYVPVLRTFAHLKPRKAIGTSLHVMMVVVPVSILTHLLTLSSDMYSTLGEEFLLILIFMALTLLGSRNGAKYGMKYLSEQQLMKLFLFVIIVVALKYVIDLSGF